MIDSDSEILQHPRLDILKLLSIRNYDPYLLCKELGITYRDCYHHLKILEKLGLMGGHFRYHITERGRQILSKMAVS